jgi:3-methyladenine DNA glycosylase AlkD
VNRSLLLKLQSEFKRVADPKRAPGMQRYMKSTMPFHGVAATPMRQVCRECFKALNFKDAQAWRQAVLYIFRNARFREEWYAAVELSLWKNSRAYQTPDMLSMYEEMIVTSSWWDIVDTLAGHGVGSLLREYPKALTRDMRTWSHSDNIWKRRTSILSQLTFKKDTDLRLLYSCIEPSLDSSELFLRKAIGWALRQYAWTDPAEVKRYVRENESRLSPLSKREAMKNIG